MSVNVNFNTLTLVDDGVVLSLKNNQEKEISFLELDKIYMKVYKLNPLSELGFILVPFLLIFLSVQFVTLEKVILVGVFTVIPVFIRINTYKNYSLIICLKDGTIFRKKVSLYVKGENISVVNAVRREQLNHYAKTKHPYKLESLEFCENMAS